MTMEAPDESSAEEEIPVSKPATATNRRVRKKRTRVDKNTMYAIELHRHNLRVRLMIALGVLVFAAILLLLVAWYPGTSHFRGRLDRMILHSTGARVEIENLVLTPFSATADRLDAKWPEGNFLHSLSAGRLSGTVLPQRHFGRTYSGDELSAVTGQLTLRYPTAGSHAIVPEAASGKSRVGFNRLGISRMDVRFGEPDAPGGAKLVDTEAAFYPNGPAGVPRALLYSGRLNLPHWPEFLLDRAIIDFPAGCAHITGMRIRDKLPELNSDALVGWAEISGEFQYDSGGSSELQLVLDGFEIQSLLGEEVGRFFSGRVDTRAGGDAGLVRISKEDGLQMRAELVGSPVSEFTFRHFPFLGFISRAVDDRWFMNPVFDDGPTMVFVRDSGDTLVEEIHFVSRRRMSIRGAFSIDSDNAIQGEIEVGLSPTVVDSAIARRLDGMFSAERDGFRWIKLELGGTTQLPTDNFNAQFIEAPLPEIEIPQFQPPPRPPEPEQEITPEPPRRTRPPTVLPLLDLDDD
ncbi:MAG: hypothetical protein ACNA8L_06865 [Luteolibacter sp.]